LAVPAIFFPLHAVAQSGANAVDVRTRAYTADSQVGGRKPIAIIAGRAIYEDELLSLMEQQLQRLRNEEYELKSQALETLINQKLLEAAASRKGITADKLIEREVSSKIPNPSDTEIEGFYLGQRESRPLEEVKPRLLETLKRAKLDHAREAYMDSLRRESGVAILLVPPKVAVGYDPSRVRGNPDAPVTIVEFSDYECPFCRGSEEVIRTVLSKYGDKVKLAYRDFPLRQIHPHSLAAAEASRCASEQGKFWQYHDLLFSVPNKLDAAGLLEHARAVGLNETQFLSCLNTEKFKSAVDADVRAGSNARVSGTPAFFINGIFVSGAQPPSVFQKTIDSELARLTASSSISSNLGGCASGIAETSALVLRSK
jgi:predicted DsbA family dithiol-disulfide isomerase